MDAYVFEETSLEKKSLLLKFFAPVEMNAHKKIIKDNVRTILKIIVREYNGIYSPVLYSILKRHPDFPSFLAFQYILR